MSGTRQPSSNAEQLFEEVKVLNETVTLLESQLNQQRQKNIEIKAKLDHQENKTGEIKKLQLKLR